MGMRVNQLAYKVVHREKDGRYVSCVLIGARQKEYVLGVVTKGRVFCFDALAPAQKWLAETWPSGGGILDFIMVGEVLGETIRPKFVLRHAGVESVDVETMEFPETDDGLDMWKEAAPGEIVVTDFRPVEMADWAATSSTEE